MRHPYSNEDLMIDCLVMGEYIDLDIYATGETFNIPHGQCLMEYDHHENDKLSFKGYGNFN